MKATLLEEGEKGVGLVSTGFFDQEIYGGEDSRFAGYVTSIAANEQEDVSVTLPTAWIHALMLMLSGFCFNAANIWNRELVMLPASLLAY